MYAGQAVEAASTRDLFERPSHPYTRGLLQCLPTPGIRGRHARLGTIPGMVPTPIGLPPQCGFANRCPQATPLCTAGDIPLTAVATGHESRRSEEHTSETPVTNAHLVCRLLLEKKKKSHHTQNN